MSYFSFVCMEKYELRCCCLFAVGMVKQPTAEQSEFQMSNEDFPALPGTQIGDSVPHQSSLTHVLNNNIVGGGGNSVMDLGGSMDGKNVNHHGSGAIGAGMILNPEVVSAQDKAFKRGVQTSPDGRFFLSLIVFLTMHSTHFSYCCA